MINFLDFLGLESINLESIIPILNPFWTILKAWWWVFIPFILFPYFRFFYQWYIESKWDDSIERILLEIRIPKEIERPMKAMEQVFSNFWTLYDPPTWKEKWLEGHTLLSFALEIVSVEGEIHFFLRVPKDLRGMFETAIYSQFPDVEITEVPDYTKFVPQDIPNKNWDSYGWDFILLKESCYPIKTYPKFFEEQEGAKEEKRVSALSVLLEGMADLKKGEQIWVQILAKPITNEVPFVAEGKKIIDKLVKRPPKPKQKSIVMEATDVLITGKPPGVEEKPKEEIIPPEMKLTPGEREVVQAIENKISKLAFETNIRFLYLGKRDVFFKPRTKIPLDFSAGLSVPALNGMKPWKTITKTVPPFPFGGLNLYLKKRRLFRRYVIRVRPLYPRLGGTFVLNTEELATLYHFPGRMMAPSLKIPRVEAKKAGPPAGIPTE